MGVVEAAFLFAVTQRALRPEFDDAPASGLKHGLALRWSFMGPFETIDLNAPAGIADYCRRYQSIYARLQPTMRERVDWAGPVLERIEAERRARVPAAALADRQRWRDRQLMALAAHKAKAMREIGD